MASAMPVPPMTGGAPQPRTVDAPHSDPGPSRTGRRRATLGRRTRGPGRRRTGATLRVTRPRATCWTAPRTSSCMIWLAATETLMGMRSRNLPRNAAPIRRLMHQGNSPSGWTPPPAQGTSAHRAAADAGPRASRTEAVDRPDRLRHGRSRPSQGPTNFFPNPARCDQERVSQVRFMPRPATGKTLGRTARHARWQRNARRRNRSRS